MCLTPHQADAIRNCTPLRLGMQSQLWLFDSLVHDNQYGGKVDLCVDPWAHPKLMDCLQCRVLLANLSVLKANPIAYNMRQHLPRRNRLSGTSKDRGATRITALATGNYTIKESLTP